VKEGTDFAVEHKVCPCRSAVCMRDSCVPCPQSPYSLCISHKKKLSIYYLNKVRLTLARLWLAHGSSSNHANLLTSLRRR
jgi:hypothetical protein